MNRLCVFCGSNPGDTPAFTEAARQLGRELARRQLGLVYGGGRVGLMGQVADATMAAGGEVIGVIPKSLEDREVGHRNITDLRVVGSMHERKAMMADLADGFIAIRSQIVDAAADRVSPSMNDEESLKTSCRSHYGYDYRLVSNCEWDWRFRGCT